jgi:hypothetical protein
MSPCFFSKYFQIYPKAVVGLLSAVFMAFGPTFSYAAHGLTKGFSTARPTGSRTQQWVVSGADLQQTISSPPDHPNAFIPKDSNDISFALHLTQDFQHNRSIFNFGLVSAVQTVGPALGPTVEHLATPLLNGVSAEDTFKGPDPRALDDLRSAVAPDRIAGRTSSSYDQVRIAGAPFDGNGLVPARAVLEPSIAGKTLLVVGTRKGREWLDKMVMGVVRKYGLDIVLLDDPNHRKQSENIIPNERFIPAPILDHSPETVDQIARQVADFTREHPIHGAVTFLNSYALVTGAIVDLLGIPGNSRRTVEIAHTKPLARALLAREHPELTVPFLVAHTQPLAWAERAARLYPDLQVPFVSGDEAILREAFEELSEGGKHKLVLKPAHQGGGSSLVRIVSGVDAAWQSFMEIDGQLLQLASSKADSWHGFDRYGGVLVERHVSGWEVDDETIYQHGKETFSMIIDNAPVLAPFAAELGSTYPSQLPQAQQLRLREARRKAARVFGVKYGSVHTELILGPDGPKIVEMNMRVGGDIIPQLIAQITGINLIEQGIRSLFGLTVRSLQGPLPVVLEERYVVARVAGTLLSMEWSDNLNNIPNFRTFMDKIGQRVTQEDWLAHLVIIADTYDKAMDWMLDALRSITVTIRTDDGDIVTQNGAEGHSRQIFSGATVYR